jgi:multisubunit Na+/H+ antiporter MnhE subunit
MECVWYFTWTRLTLSYNDIITYLVCLYLKEFRPIHTYISLNMLFIEIIGYFIFLVIVKNLSVSQIIFYMSAFRYNYDI